MREKAILHFLVVTVYLVSVFSALGAMAADTRFVPLDVGQRYVFNVKNNIGQTWQETFKVSGMTIIPPSLVYYAIDVLGMEPGDLKLVSMRSTTTTAFMYNGFAREVKAWQNGPVGTTWTYTEDDGDIKEANIEAIETVTVPAGTFTGCLKIHKKCTNCSGVTDYYEWVKPGFFLVKWVDYWTDNNPPVVYELKSWTP